MTSIKFDNQIFATEDDKTVLPYECKADVYQSCIDYVFEADAFFL